MTPEARTELALAILLWKSYRQRLGSKGVPDDTSESAAYYALDLAKAAGVLTEFHRLMMEFPVMALTVKELERRPGWVPPPKPKRSSKRCPK